jgi:glucose-6-phosphate isomerase
MTLSLSSRAHPQVFEGNRPSLSLLLPSLAPFHLGQLLALYEHRVVVQVKDW